MQSSKSLLSSRLCLLQDGRDGDTDRERMAAGAHRIMQRLPSFPSSCSAATSKVIHTFKDQEDCNGLLPWLTRKAGADISSVLRVGSSPFGRSLFASQAIQEGDCMMKVPYNVQLTEDKLPKEIHLLLDNVARDTTKIAVLLMMEQHLGHVSGWAPYVRSLPCKGQMHNMMFWDLNELHMVQNSSIYDEVIGKKEETRMEFSAVKPALERFPHLFGEIKFEDFMHASALVTSRAWQTTRGVSLIFSTMMVFLILYYYMMSKRMFRRNYAVGEQVMIRYGKYSNATLALNFGFTLSRNIYDLTRIMMDISEQDPLYKKKFDMWQMHHPPKFEHICSSGCTKTLFSIKEVKHSGGNGIGIPQMLRAFFRVFSATSIEELEEMALEAAVNDGRIARRPLKNVETEINAHRKLLLHLDDMIRKHSAAIEQLEIVNGAESRRVDPFRKEMAKDLLAGELQVLQSVHAWVANYCETANVS